ncbi:hypothetical protein B8W69_04010 [Mycobacterium vulneris]|uniref:Secreted protein n=1 Tax=Mycolicibacterium vulneris TaxID=547163 RepID=A0A1X2LC61_9MYCO|nr:hypothetical protein [Mycolicibacterium vulneris]OSC31609.1 hypothetical protein B8W69_04010 [Mycolicibacterium vulneris]
MGEVMRARLLGATLLAGIELGLSAPVAHADPMTIDKDPSPCNMVRKYGQHDAVELIVAFYSVSPDRARAELASRGCLD